MKHLVVTTERAAQEIVDAAVWWAGERSVTQAERWDEGIRAASAGLQESAEARPVAAERTLAGYELRELHYGLGSRATHRVIFTIVGETVLVLTVRHVARGPIQPDEF